MRDPERRTLIACSGGADSSALALCLAAASSQLVIAHVLHDLRPEREARADLDAAGALAAGLSIPFGSARVECKSKPGNAEAVARRERYAALLAMAREHACPFVATAHHADDQLETILMRFVRGAGPRGLAGIAPKRRIAPGVTLIRPMLEITRAEAEAICRGAGVAWAEDATNSDRSRLRAALRHDVIPPLRAIAPSITTTAGRVASVQREVARGLELAAAALLFRAMDSEDAALVAEPGAPRKPERERDKRRVCGQVGAGIGGDESVECLGREALVAGSPAILELALRRVITRVGETTDAISNRTLKRLAAAVRSDSRETKLFEFPNATARLDATRLTVRSRSPRSEIV